MKVLNFKERWDEMIKRNKKILLLIPLVELLIGKKENIGILFG